MTKPERIDLSPEELDALLERVESGSLASGDFELIKAMAETIAYLSQAVDQKGVQLKRLLRTLFGSKSEKAEVLFGNSSEDSGGDASEEHAREGEGSEAETKKKRRGGNGKRPASDYSTAQKIAVAHADHKPGDRCPDCDGGVLYEQKVPGKIVRVRATPPFQATVYELQKLRCGLCGKIFTAAAPEGVGTAKYDESVVALIALLKYGMGLPFYRLERLQESLGVPLASSTQWDILERHKERFQPALDELYREAALGQVVHNDDTNVKILDLMGKRREKLEEPPKRRGMYTSGIVSRSADRTIALYFSGSRHAGENLDRLLALRPEEHDRPIQMCDGLDHNVPREAKTLVANCLLHGRRQFLDVLESFPREVRYLVDELAKIYRVDARARHERLSDQKRLSLHQRKSAPRMKKLRSWLDDLLAQKRVEPNSPLGEAIQYMTKRWERMTVFLREPGAPLDNNLVERALKRAILNRKNSLFYRSEKGAELGDLFMSLIHSAELSGANPFDYLFELARNSEQVRRSPSEWMPWNYRETLDRSMDIPPRSTE